LKCIIFSIDEQRQAGSTTWPAIDNRTRSFSARPIIFVYSQRTCARLLNLLCILHILTSHNLALQILLSVPLIDENKLFFFDVNDYQIFSF